MADLAIIVVSYNTAPVLQECLASILATRSISDTDIIVVDNNSSDDSVEMIRREFPMVRLVKQSTNVGFGSANNAGVAATNASIIMLLNSDAILQTDTAGGLARYLAEHPEACCVGPRIVLPNGEPQPRVFGNQPTLWRIAMQTLYLGLLFPRIALLEGTDGIHRPGSEHRVGWISGVCMVMRRNDFLAAGGFDPAIFMYCEDVDLCSRLARQGRSVVLLDRLAVLHYGGASAPTMAAQLRNTVWAQRNILRIVRHRSGSGTAIAAQVIMFVGMICRIAAGLAAIPRRGIRDNLLLRSSWARLLDLAGGGSYT